MNEAAGASEPSVSFYQTTRRYNPKGGHLFYPPLYEARACTAMTSCYMQEVPNRSLCCPVTSSFLGPNILLGTLFSHTLNLRSTVRGKTKFHTHTKQQVKLHWHVATALQTLRHTRTAIAALTFNVSLGHRTQDASIALIKQRREQRAGRQRNKKNFQSVSCGSGGHARHEDKRLLALRVAAGEGVTRFYDGFVSEYNETDKL
jgi:hypothetical protein